MSLLSLLLVVLWADLSAGLHNLHVSHGRMAVEANVVTLQIRFFDHDLENALKQYHGSDDLRLATDAASDNAFLEYFGVHFALSISGDTLHPKLVGSGEGPDIWWYEVQFCHSGPITSLQISNTLLFDLFGDQKNVIALTRFPEGKRESLYFVRGSAEYELSFV